MSLHILPSVCPLCKDQLWRNPRAPFIQTRHDITGQLFGRLTIQHYFGIVKQRSLWCCLCTCQTPRIIVGNDMLSGKTQSCGCLNREINSKALLAEGTMMACSQCKEVKLLEAFANNHNGSHRKQPLCRACQHIKNLAYYATHREEVCAQVRTYSAAHPQEIRARGVAYRAANADILPAKKAAYNKAHPEICTAKNARRHAQKLGAAVNDLTAAQWKEIKTAYGFRCVYCGKKPRLLTKDHIIPLAKGGNHTVANVVPSCQSCNSKKHIGPPLVPVQPLLLTIAPGHKSRVR